MTRVALLVPLWAQLCGKFLMRTCPQCNHLLGRHVRRRDGSFID